MIGLLVFVLVMWGARKVGLALGCVAIAVPLVGCGFCDDCGWLGALMGLCQGPSGMWRSLHSCAVLYVLFDLDKLPSLSISGLGCAFSCALDLRAPDPSYSEGFGIIQWVLFGGYLFQQDIITNLNVMWSDIDFLIYSLFHGFFFLAVFCPCFCDVISACSQVCPDIWDVGAECSTK